MYLPYTGIGSRETPSNIQGQMIAISAMLDEVGFTLRSGGADGADSAFEFGVVNNKEIFLPWKNFNNNKSLLYTPPKEAFDIAAGFHPNWGFLSRGAKFLMARNIQQVLGENLDSPTLFVICWTPDGCENNSTRSRKTGGTGQAISVASYYHIPIYNLYNWQGLQTFDDLVEEVKENYIGKRR